MAFTSLSGSMSPPWYMQMGGIFKKNGLDMEVIAMPSGGEGMNALIDAPIVDRARNDFAPLQSGVQVGTFAV